VTLLEVLVALVILGAAGLGAVGLVREAVQHAARARSLEAKIQRADQALAGLVLLERSELTRRIGEHPIGEFVATIQRPEPGLFRIAVRDSGAAQPLLVTLVARSDSEP
jgi:type II secretory pathway pseudopilin PulG